MSNPADYLYVFEGETNENFVIDTVDEDEVAIDPQFGQWGAGESTLEIKTTDLSTTSTTLQTSDFVSETATSVTMLIDKIGALSAGTYVAILTLKDSGTRVKVLKFHVIVEAV